MLFPVIIRQWASENTSDPDLRFSSWIDTFFFGWLEPELGTVTESALALSDGTLWPSSCPFFIDLDFGVFGWGGTGGCWMDALGVLV